MKIFCVYKVADQLTQLHLIVVDMTALWLEVALQAKVAS